MLLAVSCSLVRALLFDSVPTLVTFPIQIPAMQYDLHLLKAMLECNSTEDGKVEQQTFTHITKMWVRDIRNRNVKSAPSEPLEVSVRGDASTNYSQPLI